MNRDVLINNQQQETFGFIFKHINQKPEMGYSDLSSEDIDQIMEDIFEKWYRTQDSPILKTVGDLKAKNPHNAREKLKNLVIDSYLYTRRADIRVSRQNLSYYDNIFSKEERALFSIMDVEFQQDMVKFLLTCRNTNLISAFWDNFGKMQKNINRKKTEIEGSIKGILIMRTAYDLLMKNNFSVYFPEAKIDARDKIDIIAQKNKIFYFCQIKSKKNGDIEIIQNPENITSSNNDQLLKLKAFLKNVKQYKERTTIPIKALLILIPNPFTEKNISNLTGELRKLNNKT